MIYVYSYLLVLASIMIHELGHYIVLLRFRLVVAELGLGFGPTLLRIGKFRLRLMAIGGYIQPEKKYSEIPPGQALMVAFAGPLASFVYAAVLYIIGDVYFNPGFKLFAEMNLYFGLFNLLPIPPLDGFLMVEGTSRWLNAPFSEKMSRLFSRLGFGFVYGMGFLVIYQIGDMVFH